MSIDWDKIDWSDWVAILVAIVAAWWSWRSAKSAEKQNELSLHQHRVAAYDAFVSQFIAGVYLDSNSLDERGRNLREFTRACMLIRFLFKHSTYRITDNILEEFRHLVELNDLIWTLDDELADPPIGFNEERANEIRVEKKQIRKELGQYRLVMLENFTECKTFLEDEITLYKPPQIGKVVEGFIPETALLGFNVIASAVDLIRTMNRRK